jgi:hypothetical protein
VDVNATNLDARAAEAEGQILQLDSEIQDLQKQLSQLRQKKRRLEAFTSYCTNLRASIAQLPAEVMLDIFACILPQTGIYIGCRAPPPSKELTIFQLGAVCFSWRNLLLSQPLLWSKIVLSLLHHESSVHPRIVDNAYTNALMRLNLCYRRSGETPMLLSLHSNGDPPVGSKRGLRALLQRLAFGARRWERIEARGVLFNLSQWMGHVGYPNLQVLYLTHDKFGRTHDLGMALQTLSSKAPKLWSLVLDLDANHWARDFTADTTTFDLSLIPSRITELRISVRNATSTAHAVHLYDLVNLHTNLSKLTIHAPTTSWLGVPQILRHMPALAPIHLPSLTSLSLRWGYLGSAISAYFKFIPPNLQDLTLHFHGSVDREELLNWTRHFSINLRTAKLIWERGETISSAICPLIETCSALSDLTLFGPGATQVFTFLSQKLSPGQFAYVPHLKVLSVHLRKGASESFLEMVAQRLSKDVPSDSRLTLAKIQATEMFIRQVEGDLLSLVQTSNYAFRVEYEFDRDGWLSLGLDGEQFQKKISWTS